MSVSGLSVYMKNQLAKHVVAAVQQASLTGSPQSAAQHLCAHKSPRCWQPLARRHEACVGRPSELLASVGDSFVPAQAS